MYIIEELKTDSLENRISEALYFEIVGYFDTLEETEYYCNNGGIIPKGQCWALDNDVKKYRYKKVKKLFNDYNKPLEVIN
jgi:hypothetical protein